MRKFKELASLSLAFAMVAGSLAVPTTAYAAETNNVTGDKVKVDYSNEEVTVEKASENTTVYYSTNYKPDKADKAVWEAVDYAVAATQASFQIAPGKNAQEIYITDNIKATPYKLELPKQETGLLVGFSGSKTTTDKSAVKVENDWTALNDKTYGYHKVGATWSYGFLCASIKDGQTVKAIDAADAENYLQYKVGTTGKWNSITKLDLRKYAAKGATLYFKIAPKDDAKAVVSGSALTNLGFASKEVKATYKKQANKPNVKIDGATKKISLAKNQEYRVITTSGASTVYGDWIKVADAHMGEKNKLNTIYLKDLYKASGSAWTYSEETAGQGIEVRTAGTDKAIASKSNVVMIHEVATPSVSTSAGISFSAVKATTFDSGIKVTNASTGCAYQVAVVSGTAATVDLTKVKWKNVPAATATAAKSITIKKADLDKGNNIIFRTATVKDDKKTAEDEFRVSSAPVDFNYKSQITLATQALEVVTATVKNAAEGVSASAVKTVTGGVIVLDVANTATAGAFDVELACTTTNVKAGSTVAVQCVASADDSAAAATADKVTLVASGKTTENAAKLIVKIKADAATESKFFRVSVDGLKVYVKVNFTK